MAATPGKSGTILYGGGSVATLNNWDVSVANDMLDVTSFTTDAPQWREFIAGLSSWTGGTISGQFDPASTGQNDLIGASVTLPVAAAIVLEMDQVNGGKLSGNCFLSDASFTADIGDVVSVSWTVNGTGALAYTTST
jgi:predicted secreted protein